MRNSQAQNNSGEQVCKVPTEFELGCLIAIRLSIAAFSLLAVTIYAAYFNPNQSSDFYSLYTPIAWLFVVCLLSAVWLAWKKTGLIFIYLQFLTDSLLVMLTIWLAGQVVSPLLLLLIPIVAGAGLLAGRTTAISIALLSLALYTAMLCSIHYGYLPLLNGNYQEYLTFGIENLIYISAGLLLALLATAWGSDYIRTIAFAGHRLANQSKQDLVDLTESNQALVDNLTEGIVTTDLNNKITFINHAATRLLRLNASNSFDDFSVLLHKEFPHCPHNFSNRDKIGLAELYGNQNNTDLHIRMKYRQIISTSGETTGWLYVLEDISELREMESQLEWQAKLVQAEAEPQVNLPNLVSDFVGQTAVMKKIFSLIGKIAPTDANVLIVGESGTGKELVAKSLHKGSRCAGKAFVAVNCGAIPENLMESQFFGHKKGSFTGADHDHKGLFVEADGGTIFLDEIAELPLTLQAKFLRVIQERVVRPVGSDRDIKVNVRIVSATNKQLKEEVEQGRFREDLYYRLNVISINMPALRDRKEDLPLLITSLLKKQCASNSIPSIAPTSLQLLMNYEYPGNIRELENILERARVLCDQVILPEHLPEQLQRATTRQMLPSVKETEIIEEQEIFLPNNLDQLLGTVERKYLEVALLKSNGIKKEAAALLGMNFRSFRYRLQKYNIDSDSLD